MIWVVRYPIRRLADSAHYRVAHNFVNDTLNSTNVSIAVKLHKLDNKLDLIVFGNQIALVSIYALPRESGCGRFWDTSGEDEVHISELITLCGGYPTVTVVFPSQRASICGLWCVLLLFVHVVEKSQVIDCFVMCSYVIRRYTTCTVEGILFVVVVAVRTDSFDLFTHFIVGILHWHWIYCDWYCPSAGQ